MTSFRSNGQSGFNSYSYDLSQCHSSLTPLIPALIPAVTEASAISLASKREVPDSLVSSFPPVLD